MRNSRTKQKDEARARRLAEERARDERAARMHRIRGVGGIAVGAIVVVAVAIAISSSANGGTGLQKGSGASKTVASVTQLLSGIPQSGAVLGNPSAKVTMTYYSDLECPICRDFTLSGGFGQLVANEVRSGKVKVVYRSLETATQDPQTFQTQHVAALAAGTQNLFWHYIELFYREQGQEDTSYVTESYLTGLAKQVPGLNLSEWQTARNDQSLVSQVQSDEAAGTAAHVTGTPTLIFQGPKGTASPSGGGLPGYSDLQKAINQIS